MPGSHDYYERLRTRPDCRDAYALRDNVQLLALRAASSRPAWVTYDAGWEAAKVVIPPFDTQVYTRLSAPLQPADTTCTLDAISSWLNANMNNGRAMRLGTEIVTIVRPGSTQIVNGVVTIRRGQHGTPVQGHAVGTEARLSTNSLLNYVKIPLHYGMTGRYLVTWDGCWTESYLIAHAGLTSHKSFQFVSDGIWLETRTRFAGGSYGGTPGFDPTRHIAAIDIRGYNKLGGTETWVACPQTPNGRGYFGPDVTKDAPLTPHGHFILWPNRWTRFWHLLELSGSSYSTLTTWVADTVSPAVQLLGPLRTTVRPAGLEEFWCEFNSSINELQPGRGDLVAYVRNFVVLQGLTAADVPPLLEQPESVVTPQLPSPIRNVDWSLQGA